MMVMMVAESAAPIKILIKDFLKSRPRKAATALPVQIPAVGSGIATNKIRPISFLDSSLSVFFAIL